MTQSERFLSQPDKMITTDFLSQLDRFNLIVRKRVTSSYTGARRSVSHGRGITIKDHRIYTPGDDFRAIDWRIYGRTDDLYIKRYEEDKSLTTHIILDCSASMNFGEHITKFDYAAMIGVGIAYLSMKENEKFKFSTFSDDLDSFVSKRGMAHLALMVNHLNKIKTDGSSKFSYSMKKYKKLIDSKSLIVVLSDFLFSIDDIEKGLMMLSGNDVKVIQVLDPVEKNFTVSGDLILKDSETKDKMRVFLNPKARKNYETKLDAHNSALAQLCNDFGFEFCQLTTEKPIFDSFYEILRSR